MTTPEDSARGLYAVGDLTVDAAMRRVTRNGRDLRLTRKSFDLLLTLVRKAPNLVSNEEFMHAVWPDQVVGHETVTQRVKLVRDALEDDPAAPTYIDVVWGQGYRLCADVHPLQDGAATRNSLGAMPGRRIAAPLALAATVLVAVLGWRALSPGHADDFSPNNASIAVMPFLNLGNDSDNEFLARGLPDTLLHKLTNLDEILVIARTSSFAASDSGADARQIGRQLHVRYLLEGSVQQASGQVRIVAQLIDTVDASHVWSIERRLPMDDLFVVQEEIVLEIATALELTLQASERERLLANGTTSVPAFLAYLKGEHASRTRSTRRLAEAMRHYQDAAELDPAFARAWLGIAKSYLEQGYLGIVDPFEVWTATNNYLGKTFALDESIGAAYAVKARSLAFEKELSEEERNIENRRLLEIAYRHSPRDPVVLRMYAGALCSSREKDRVCQQRKAQLLREAIARDPEYAEAYVTLGWTLVALDQSVGPGYLFMESIRRDPEYIPGYRSLARWYWGSHEIDWERSVVCLCEALERDPDNPYTYSMLARVHVDLGLGNAAEEFLEQAGERPESLQWVADYDRLKLELYRGNVEKAAEYARRSIHRNSSGSNSIITLGAILEAALKSGDYADDIAAIETILQTPSFPIEYEDGKVRSRTNAFAAVVLSELQRAAGNEEVADELVHDARVYFEREIANKTMWRRENAWAYATTLVRSGEFTAALSELETVPDGYLRNAWYLDRFPALASLRDHSRYQQVRARIRHRIASERQAVRLLDDKLPPCVLESEYDLPGLLALGQDAGTPDDLYLAQALVRRP